MARPVAPIAGGVPSAAQVLRRALLAWGLGHIRLGDRRGWLLLVLEPVAALAILALAAALIDGTRWLILLLPLVAFIVVWIGQALDAYRRAVRAGGETGGELAVTLILPVALTVLTAFWLIGGRHGSPTATLQAYIEAWTANRPDAATPLFTTAVDEPGMRALWNEADLTLAESIGRAHGLYGDESGLNPERPFDSLRFREQSVTDGRAQIVLEIVRSRRVETTLLGIIPTASQETVVVAHTHTISLELVRDAPPAWLSAVPLESYVWKISSVDPVPT
jgi:hypothetical protein